MTDHLEPAETKYNHWSGTFAADNERSDALAERIGLDPDRHTIVGFTAELDEEMHAVNVYAVDLGDVDAFILDDHLDADGELPVIEFRGTGLRLDEFLGLFKRIAIEARRQFISRDVPITIAERRPLPFGDAYDHDDDG